MDLVEDAQRCEGSLLEGDMGLRAVVDEGRRSGSR